MPVFEKAIPTTDAEVCRGKSGKSRPHVHYRGRNERVVELDGIPTYASRCTSCGEIVVWAFSSPGRPVTENPVVLPNERLEALGRAMVAAL